MAKIIDIKTKREITETRELTARDLTDQLYVIRGLLEDAGFEDVAIQVQKAIGKIMPRVISDKRQNLIG